jgi:hypothetical protein
MSKANPGIATPNIGVATAASVNKVAFTAPATSATITIADGTALTQTTSTSVGRGQYRATNTNDAATAGNIGEYKEQDIDFASRVNLSTRTAKTVASLALEAGDRDVTGVVIYFTDTTTSVTKLAVSLNTTTNTFNGNGGFFTEQIMAATVMGSATPAYQGTVARFSLSATTTVYLIARGSFTVSTLDAYGKIRARRVR